jgi:hypothetical protein
VGAKGTERELPCGRVASAEWCDDGSDVGGMETVVVVHRRRTKSEKSNNDIDEVGCGANKRQRQAIGAVGRRRKPVVSTERTTRGCVVGDGHGCYGVV